MESQAALVRARATVALPGLPVGSVALVDPSDPYIAERIGLGLLSPEGTPDAGATGEPEA